MVLYTTTTEDVSNTITATSSNGDVDIDVDGTPVNSGDPATWEEGINHVTVTVIGIDETGIYRIDVTKTEA